MAVATGTPLHLVRPLGFSLDGSRLRRAGLDYWPRLDLRLHDRIPSPAGGGRLVAFSSQGTVAHWEAGLGRGDLLLFGPEDQGLPQDAIARADLVVRIPLLPEERSLNLAMAAAVGLFEALRPCGHETMGG